MNRPILQNPASPMKSHKASLWPRILLVLAACAGLVTACTPSAGTPPPPPTLTTAVESAPLHTPEPTLTPAPTPTETQTPEPDAWPFPDDPVVESIKLTEDEMKEKNAEFYNEVAPILADAGIIVEKWMQHPDTGEIFMLVHHQDGGGQFMMTDHKYSNGHVLFGFNTGETKFAMDNLLLQPAEDDRKVAVTLQDAPNGNSLDSMWLDLAAMAHLLNRVGMGNMSGTLEKMKAAIARERANMGSDEINFIILHTAKERGEELPPAPFSEMHTLVENKGVPSLKTNMMLRGNTILVGIQQNRAGLNYSQETLFRGPDAVDLWQKNPNLEDELKGLPPFIIMIFMEESLYRSLISSIMAGLAENSMPASWFIMYQNDFFASGPIFYDTQRNVDPKEWDQFNKGERSTLPDHIVSNLTQWMTCESFLSVQLIK